MDEDTSGAYYEGGKESVMVRKLAKIVEMADSMVALSRSAGLIDARSKRSYAILMVLNGIKGWKWLILVITSHENPLAYYKVLPCIDNPSKLPTSLQLHQLR